jgi:hypothetical protein
MHDRVGTKILIIGLFAALSAAFFWRVFVGELLLPTEFLRYFQPWEAHVEPAPYDPQWNPLAADGILQFYPWRVFAAERLREGTVPLWNPYQFCGAPFLANAQSAVLYPLNILFWVMNPASAFGYSAILHMFLLQLFTYVWLRRLGLSRAAGVLGAVSFAFCGFCVVWTHLPTLVASLAWLPAALACHEWWRASRRTTALVCTAAALGMSILAGHPQMAYYVLLTYALYATLRAMVPWRGWGAWPEIACGTAALAVGVALAMAQLLPMLELTRLSHRAAIPAQLAANMRMALKPEHLVGLLVPDFYGNPRSNNFWGAGNYVESAGYVSAVVWVFALYAALSLLRRRTAGLRDIRAAAQVAGIMAGAAVLAAFGPLAYVGFYIVPGFAHLPAVGRLLGVFGLFMAALGACGLDMFFGFEHSSARRNQRWLTSAGMVAVALALLTIALAPLTSRIQSQGIFLYNLVRFSGGQVGKFILMDALVVGLGIGAARGAIRRPRALGMICLVGIGNVFWLGMGYNYWAIPEEVFPETPEIAATKLIVKANRLLPLSSNWTLCERPTAVMPPNTATLCGMRDINGYDSLYWLPYKRLADEVEGRDSSPSVNGNMILIRNYESPLLPEMSVGAMLSPVPLKASNLKPVAGSESLILYEVTNVRPRAEIVEGRGRAVITSDGSNCVGIRCVCEGDARLVLRDCAYPGWRVRVDGRDRKLERSLAVFRSVTLDEGTHKVVFSFEPESFRVGVFVSCLAAALIVGAVVFEFVGARTRE